MRGDYLRPMKTRLPCIQLRIATVACLIVGNPFLHSQMRQVRHPNSACLPELLLGQRPFLGLRKMACRVTLYPISRTLTMQNGRLT
jgi:hypothetical protein